jgi:uncharacterized protein (DUF1800 family)
MMMNKAELLQDSKMSDLFPASHVKDNTVLAQLLEVREASLRAVERVRSELSERMEMEVAWEEICVAWLGILTVVCVGLFVLVGASQLKQWVCWVI